MVTYKNLGGDSNIRAYKIDTESISVEFNDKSIYHYTCESVGSSNIVEMHRLALLGQGLNSFINKNVRKNYTHKS